MSPLSRRILFYAFLGGFLIAAPAVVFYTAGYRWNPGVARIVQTGLLSLESTPSGARTLIDGVLRTDATPSLQKNIIPGLHTVEVQKTGYLPWSKSLPFFSRETTFAQALLFAEAGVSRVWAADPLTSAIDPIQNRIATARAQGAWTEVWTLDPAQREERLVARYPTRSARVQGLEWSGDGSALRMAGGDLISGSLGAFAYAPNYILSSTGDRVSIARLRPPALPELVASIPGGTYAFQFAPNGFLLLADADRKRLVLTTTDGDQPMILSATAEQWAWEPDGTRLLYSDNYDIHLFDPATHTDTTITRVSDPLTGLAWHPSGLGVIFSQDTRVSAIEFADQGGRVLTVLAEGTGLRHAWVDPRGRTLYFLGTVGKETGLFERLLVR